MVDCLHLFLWASVIVTEKQITLDLTVSIYIYNQCKEMKTNTSLILNSLTLESLF